jgi:ammonium transporter, Amt family
MNSIPRPSHALWVCVCACRIRIVMLSFLSHELILAAHTLFTHNQPQGSGQGYLSTSNPNPLVGMGMVDFAGSGVVHVTGGMTALYATYILGPRRGRFTDANGKPLARLGLTKGHSTSLQMLGTMILWFCWYGFNAGSALLLSVPDTSAVGARAALTTTLAAASGTVSALLTNAWRQERRTGEFTLDISMAMNGW